MIRPYKGSMDTRTTYQAKPAPEPVFFVDPETGECLELDLRTASYTTEKGDPQ